MVETKYHFEKRHEMKRNEKKLYHKETERNAKKLYKKKRKENDSHPTGVVKPVYGIPAFPSTAKAV